MLFLLIVSCPPEDPLHPERRRSVWEWTWVWAWSREWARDRKFARKWARAWAENPRGLLWDAPILLRGVALRIDDGEDVGEEVIGMAKLEGLVAKEAACDG